MQYQEKDRYQQNNTTNRGTNTHTSFLSHAKPFIARRQRCCRSRRNKSRSRRSRCRIDSSPHRAYDVRARRTLRHCLDLTQDKSPLIAVFVYQVPEPGVPFDWPCDLATVTNICRMSIKT